MIIENTEITKNTFSGHDSFQCRQLWLKKGYDYIQEGKNFNDEDAVVQLGVGKNMVSSIRFWLKVFNVIDNKDIPTEIWELTKKCSGISVMYFHEYFENRLIAHNIKIKNTKKYNRTLSLIEDFNVLPLQSYLYLNEEVVF
ncbi:MAG: DUF4007 family protein [Bacteroidetes bacterium]|nr:DUF4007 family protein [Bacteroidota bacterium]